LAAAQKVAADVVDLLSGKRSFLSLSESFQLKIDFGRDIREGLDDGPERIGRQDAGVACS
jgi:hypothetical protein